MAEEMRKVFDIIGDDGKEISLAIERPKQSVINEAELIYSSYFTKAISRGVLTSDQVKLMIKEQKLWTKKDEDKVKNILLNIRKCEKKLKAGKLSDKKTFAICEQLKDLREDLDLIEGKRSKLFSKTAEWLADGVRSGFLVSECTVYADSGEKYYDSYEDYMEKVDLNTSIINLNAYNFFYGLNQVDKKEDIEIEILKSKNKIDAFGNRLDKNGALVDENGTRINENGNYVITIDGEDHISDMFGNPLDENGEIDIELDKKVHPKDYK